jgi:hypothetical protein
MGKYINQLIDGRGLPAKNKANFLVSFAGAEVVEPTEFEPNLVCVVENPAFDAAAWAETEDEFKRFNREDGRPKTWLVLPQVSDLAK